MSNVSTDSGSAVEIVYDDSDIDTTRIINSIFINEGRNVIEKEHTFDRLEIDNCELLLSKKVSKSLINILKYSPSFK